MDKGESLLGCAPLRHALSPPMPCPLPEPRAALTGVQPAGEGQGAVLHVEGEVVDVEATGGHHLKGLVVLDLAVMPNVHVWDTWRLPHVHTGQGRGSVWGFKKQVKLWESEGL